MHSLYLNTDKLECLHSLRHLHSFCCRFCRTLPIKNNILTRTSIVVCGFLLLYIIIAPPSYGELLHCSLVKFHLPYILHAYFVWRDNFPHCSEMNFEKRTYGIYLYIILRVSSSSVTCNIIKTGYWMNFYLALSCSSAKPGASFFSRTKCTSIFNKDLCYWHTEMITVSIHSDCYINFSTLKKHFLVCPWNKSFLIMKKYLDQPT
jgi:hypothetical protein